MAKSGFDKWKEKYTGQVQNASTKEKTQAANDKYRATGTGRYTGAGAGNTSRSGGNVTATAPVSNSGRKDGFSAWQQKWSPVQSAEGKQISQKQQDPTPINANWWSGYKSYEPGGGRGGSTSSTDDILWKRFLSYLERSGAGAGKTADEVYQDFLRGKEEYYATFDVAAAQQARDEALKNRGAQNRQKTQSGRGRGLSTVSASASADTTAKVSEIDAWLDVLNNDIEMSKSVQYDRAGAEALDKLQAENSNAYSAIDKVATKYVAMYSSTGGSTNIFRGARKAYTKALEDAKVLLGSYGYTDAQIAEYIDYRTRQLNRDRYEASEERVTQLAQSGFLGAAAATGLRMATGITSGIEGAFDLATQRASGKPVDWYSHGISAQRLESDIVKTVAGEIEKSTNWEIAGQNVAAFLYQTGISIGDSAAIAGMTALGIPAWLGTAALGTMAGTQAAIDAHERGISDSKAFTTGLVAGIAEAVFERVSLETLLKPGAVNGTTVGKRFLQVLRNIGVQSFTEGSEELFTDLANAMSDEWINGGQREFNENVRRYILSGMSEEEAYKAASRDFAVQVGSSFVGGAISGGLMSSVTQAITTHSANKQAKAIYGVDPQALVDEALELDPNNETAQKAKEKLEQGKQLSGGEIRLLVEQNERQIAKTKGEESRTASQETASKVVYSDNAVVQQAATLLRDGKIALAVSAVMTDAEAQKALGLDFGEDTTNTEKRTQIKTVLEALIQQTGEAAAVDESMETAQTDEESSAVQTAEAAEQAAKEASENAESAPDLQELEQQAGMSYEQFRQQWLAFAEKTPGMSTVEEDIQAGYRQYSSDRQANTFTDPSGRVWTKEEFVDYYINANPEASREQAEQLFMYAKREADNDALAKPQVKQYNEKQATKNQQTTKNKEAAKHEKGQKTETVKESGEDAGQLLHGLGDGGGLQGRSGVRSDRRRGGVRSDTGRAAGEGAPRGDRLGSGAQRGDGGIRGNEQGDRSGENSRRQTGTDRGRPELHSRGIKSAGAEVHNRKTETGDVVRSGVHEQGKTAGEGGKNGAGGSSQSAGSRQNGGVASHAGRQSLYTASNIPTFRGMIDARLGVLERVRLADMPEEYRGLAKRAERIGAKLYPVLNGVRLPDGHRVPALHTGKRIIVSLNYAARDAETCFNHEFTHHAVQVLGGLREQILTTLAEDNFSTEKLLRIVRKGYMNYEKHYGALTEQNQHKFIEELLCDAYAGIVRKNVEGQDIQRLHELVAPVIDAAVAVFAQDQTDETRPFWPEIDEDDIPAWAYGEQDGGEYEDGEYEDDIYEDVLPEDKHEGVEVGSWEETGDAEVNEKYYNSENVVHEDETPAGLEPEEVIYDPDRLAYYDKASGRLVIYDEVDGTFHYDEFGELFEDAGDVVEYPSGEKERIDDLHTPPDFTGTESAVADRKPTDTNTDAFKQWFNDPTPGRELSTGKRGKKPKTLFHGSVAAGFTQFRTELNSSSIFGGIYLTDDASTAAIYADGKNREFKPVVVKTWSEAQHYARRDLGMRLEQKDDGTYALYTYNEKTGQFEESHTFSADEAGLRSFNEVYGEAHNGVRTPGVYRLYGTSQNALVLDAHNRGWEHVLYDPVGRAIDDDPNTTVGKWWRTDDVVDYAFAHGYDCVIIKNVNEGVSALCNDYVFKDPGQVKSVYNEGTWNRDDSELRYFDEEEMEAADKELRVLYDADTGQFYFDGRLYENRLAFKKAAAEFKDDYEPHELNGIIGSLENLGFYNPRAEFFLTPSSRELIKTVAHESRKANVTDGYGSDYGVGHSRGLLTDSVIYDASYDDPQHPTPFFERETGKEVYYCADRKRFFYDEVQDALKAEDPALFLKLIQEEHFEDFTEDQYRDFDAEPATPPENIRRKPYSQQQREQLRHAIIQQFGSDKYAKNLQNWFNDPTKTHELTAANGMPLVLYHGSRAAGYTRFDKTRLRRRGIFTASNFDTAEAYGSGTEIVPLELKNWRVAKKYLSDHIGLHLLQTSEDIYTLYAYDTDQSGSIVPMATYPATEEGLRQLNKEYGDLHSKSGIGYEGYYRFYGTSDKAFVLNAANESWHNILYNPNGYTANPGAKHRISGDFWDTDDLADFLFSQGYDCLIVKNVADGSWYDNTDYIFKDPGQLKSIYNVGIFDRTNSDIRYFDEASGEEIYPAGLTFEEQIDLALSNELDRKLETGISTGVNRPSSAVYVMFETPEKLSAINMQDLPVLVTQKHLRDAHHRRIENANGYALPGNEHYHGISTSVLKKLPELLRDPVMLIKGAGSHNDDVIVVTTEQDYRKRQIIVTIHPNGKATYNGVNGPANFITSLYGYGKQPSDIRGMIELASKQKRVMYADGARSQEIMSQGEPIAHPGFDGLAFDTVLDTISDPKDGIQLRKFYDEDESAASFEALIRRAEAAYQKAQEEADAHPVTAKEVGSIAQVDEHMAAWVIYRRAYGDIRQTGENYRKVAVPRSTDGKTRVSKTVSTVMGAEITNDDRLKTIASAVVDGKLSHVPVSDKLAENRARAKINKDGFQTARSDWSKAIASGKVNKDLVAMGATLLNNTGNSSATGREYVDILTDYADLLRAAAQALQAAKILKTLSPEAQLYAVQRQVDKINEDLTKRGFDPTKHPEVSIDQELIDAYRKAKTDAERAAIMEQIAQNIADQIPATFMDKFTAWRYLAMLGNFRTQVRNVSSNFMMQPLRMLKASTAGLAEALVQRCGGNIERTTSALHDWETFKVAFEDYQSVRELILGGGKFDDARRFAREIEERRRIFKSKLLEGYRRATNWAMDTGDSVFCAFTYADALSRFMKANKTTWSEASEELKDRAREIAIREAAEATYRDNNTFSNFVVRMRVHDTDNTVRKVANAVVEGIIPFRKTPANILVRAFEYSPAGLLHGAVSAARKAAGNQNVTGNQIIDQLAKGFTGTGLMFLGFALASMGLLVGKAPEDDKEKEQWKREGHQAYALEVGGHSYTLDWMAPTSIPLFLGANLCQAFLEDGLTLDAAISAISTITDPVLEMSMLQGIQDLIDNAANYGDDSALVRLTTDALWSYASQTVPTLLGQIERAGDNQRMQTYTDKNTGVPTDWQYALGKLSARIPGWDYAQVVYIDAWGRKHSNADTATLNVLQQLFSPGYSSPIETSAMEKELDRLYKATGDKGVLIGNAQKYIEVAGERKNLTADEYLSYAGTRGQTAYRVITDLTQSTAYKGMSDSEKASAVAKVYDYANQIGKARVDTRFTPDEWVTNADSADLDLGMSEAEFITAYLTYGSNLFTGANYEKLKSAVDAGIPIDQYATMKSSVDANNNGSVSQVEAQAYLNSTSFTRQQKALLWSLLNSGWKTNPYR